MLSRNRSLRIPLVVQIFVFIVCITFLAFWLPYSLADTSIYFSGGQKIVEGIDAYNGDSPFFSGPTGSAAFYFLGKLLLIERFPFVWQLVNVLGLCLFFYFILKLFRIERYTLIIIGLLLLSAPVREMIVNNQVTGFAIGLSSSVIYFSSKFTGRVSTAASLILLALLFEFKPNLVLGFGLYFLYLNRSQIKLLTFSLISTLAGFLWLTGPEVYSNWIDFIRFSGSEKLTGYESLGISSFLFENDLLSLNSARNLGVLLFVLSLAFSLFHLIRSNSESWTLAVPFLVLTFPYIHYLDFVSVVPFICVILLRQESVAALASAALVLLYLPQPSASFSKNLLIMAIVLFVAGFQYLSGVPTKWVTASFMLGLVLIPVNYWIDTFGLIGHSLQVVTVVRAWAVIVLLLILMSFQSLSRNRAGSNSKTNPQRIVLNHE
jgi:hypothetical protein